MTDVHSAGSCTGPHAVLRQMTRDDLPAVMAIERSTFPADAWTEGMMRGELSDQPRSRHYLVAIVDGEVIGYAGLAAAGDQADGAVALGIGSALLSGLLDEAARRGAKSVFLEVRADNPPAQAMYERFGFERIGVRRRYYDDGTDAYTMVRRLDE